MFGPGLLWVWYEVYPLPCISLLLPLLAAGLMAVGFREALIMRRRMWVHWYLDKDSRLGRWASRSLLLSLRALLMGVFFSLVLFFSSLARGTMQAWILLLDSFFIAGLYLGIMQVLHRVGVRDTERPVLAKHWTVLINVPLVLLVLVVITLNSPPPDYLVVDNLYQTLQMASEQVASECAVTDTVARFMQERDALGWWLMLRGGERLGSELLRGIAWAVFLLSGGLAWWGFSRLCVQVVDMAYRCHRDD